MYPIPKDLPPHLWKEWERASEKVEANSENADLKRQLGESHELEGILRAAIEVADGQLTALRDQNAKLVATLGRSEWIASTFHSHYERLAIDFGYRTREASALEWKYIPEKNQRLMIATVQAVIEDIVRVAALRESDESEVGDER